jgi:hypothetical protein
MSNEKIDLEELNDKGLKMGMEGQYKKANEIFDLVLSHDSKNFNALCNKAIINTQRITDDEEIHEYKESNFSEMSTSNGTDGNRSEIEPEDMVMKLMEQNRKKDAIIKALIAFERALIVKPDAYQTIFNKSVLLSVLGEHDFANQIRGTIPDDDDEFNSNMEVTKSSVEQWKKEDVMKGSEKSEDIQKEHDLNKKYGKGRIQ